MWVGEVRDGAPARVRWEFGPLVVDVLGCEALVDGRRVSLTMAQWAMLVRLAVMAGNVVPHEELIRAADIRSSDDRVSLRAIIQDLRARLGSAGRLICSTRGAGYRLAPAGDERDQLPTEQQRLA